MTPREFANHINQAIREGCTLEPVHQGLFAIRGNWTGSIAFADQMRNTIAVDVGQGRLSAMIDYRDETNDRWIERDDTLLVELALRLS